ncbi:MAG: hypothetical protein WCP55_23335 [Lentisphaerota bacterium]
MKNTNRKRHAPSQLRQIHSNDAEDVFLSQRLPEDWVYEPAAECWQDGLIIGNGNLGVIGYAPYGLEWTINKGDIFDGRHDLAANALPDREVMARVERERAKSLEFLSEAERPPASAVSPLTKIAGLLKLKFGEEHGWAAARPHAVRQRLSLAEGVLHNDLDMHLSHPRIACFVQRGRNLFCLRVANCGGAQWGTSWSWPDRTTRISSRPAGVARTDCSGWSKPCRMRAPITLSPCWRCRPPMRLRTIPSPGRFILDAATSRAG